MSEEVWASSWLIVPILSNDIIPLQALLAGPSVWGLKGKVTFPLHVLSKQSIHRNPWTNTSDSGESGDIKVLQIFSWRDSAFMSLCNFLIFRWNTAGLRQPRWNQTTTGQKVEEGNGPPAYLDFPGCTWHHGTRPLHPETVHLSSNVSKHTCQVQRQDCQLS